MQRSTSPQQHLCLSNRPSLRDHCDFRRKAKQSLGIASSAPPSRNDDSDVAFVSLDERTRAATMQARRASPYRPGRQPSVNTQHPIEVKPPLRQSAYLLCLLALEQGCVAAQGSPPRG